MVRRSIISAALLALLSLPAASSPLSSQGRPDRTVAYRSDGGHYGNRVDEFKLAERRGFKRVSDLTNFPRFFPGLGIVTVRPSTLPMGPFLSFDREKRLMSTTYMISLAEMADHKKFNLVGLSKRADHTTVYYNDGHPGVTMPHYHFVVWHVSKAEEARVAK